MRLRVAVVLVLGACGGAPVCGDVECAAVCEANKPPPLLTPFEESVLGPAIDDIRQGIRAWSDTSVGVCKGMGRDCEEWIGTTAENLPPGEYMLRAELRVPRAGGKGTWKVRLDTECTTTRKTASGEPVSTTATHSREYDELQYAGEEHGTRLSPMYRITSPNAAGAQSCTWKIVSLHPDEPAEWSGRWSVPADNP